MELNRVVIETMQKLRRKLRAEQNLVIHLNDPNAIPAMLAACLNSSDRETRALGEELAALSDEQPATLLATPAPVMPASTSGSVRIYRGQRIYV